MVRLKRLYPKTCNRDLAVMFGRSVLGIIGKARGLGLEKDYAGGYRRQRSLNPAPWSTEETNLLRKLFPITPNEEIAERIGKTLDAVAMKAKNLGLRKNQFWSETEDKLLKKLYKKLNYDLLAELLGRTKGSVQIRVITLELESKVENWTQEEIDFLKESYPGTHYRVIANKLGRTPAAVAAKADKIGIVQNWFWPESDIRKLKQFYTKLTTHQVAEMIGRSFESVRGKIKHLGLCKKKLQTEDELEVVEKQFQYEPADTVAVSECDEVEFEVSNKVMVVS